MSECDFFLLLWVLNISSLKSTPYFRISGCVEELEVKMLTIHGQRDRPALFGSGQACKPLSSTRTLAIVCLKSCERICTRAVYCHLSIARTGEHVPECRHWTNSRKLTFEIGILIGALVWLRDAHTHTHHRTESRWMSCKIIPLGAKFIFGPGGEDAQKLAAFGVSPVPS